MDVPIPPRVVRRVLRDPLWVPLCLLVLLLLVLLSIPFVLVSPLTPHRRTLRLLRMGIASVWLELSILVGCWVLWLRHPSRSRDEIAWRRAHVAMIGAHLHRFVAVAERTVGLQLADHLPDSTVQRAGPQLLLGRHAGPGDTLLVAYFVTYRMRRAPRVVLKRFLLWDAAMDVALNRLGAYFLPARGTPAPERTAQLAAFARSLRHDDAMLLFPEGGNWTPGRHTDAIAWAREHGRPAQSAWLEQHRYVLPPRPGGTQQVLSANPAVAVSLLTHYGLGRLHSPLVLWRALPLRQPVRIEAWSAPRPVDLSLEGVQSWLEEHWAAIDRWVVECARAELADETV